MIAPDLCPDNRLQAGLHKLNPPDHNAIASVLMDSSASFPTKPRLRAILVGVGGATCSGKTTLSKLLQGCIPNSIIIHQDDFWTGKISKSSSYKPQSLLPVHPEYGVPDCEDAPGAIDWVRMRKFLKEVKDAVAILESHDTHDSLNERQNIITSSNDMLDRWRESFKRFTKQYEEERHEKIIWVLVEGFLMYWDQQIIDLLDARIFLRISHDVIKQRREKQTYFTSDNAIWRDPPGYFDQIVYPAYVRAHKRIFIDGDLENGAPNDSIERLELIECEEINNDELFEKAIKAIWDASQV